MSLARSQNDDRHTKISSRTGSAQVERDGQYTGPNTELIRSLYTVIFPGTVYGHKRLYFSDGTACITVYGERSVYESVPFDLGVYRRDSWWKKTTYPTVFYPHHRSADLSERSAVYNRVSICNRMASDWRNDHFRWTEHPMDLSTIATSRSERRCQNNNHSFVHDSNL